MSKLRIAKGIFDPLFVVKDFKYVLDHYCVAMLVHFLGLDLLRNRLAIPIAEAYTCLDNVTKEPASLVVDEIPPGAERSLISIAYRRNG